MLVNTYGYGRAHSRGGSVCFRARNCFGQSNWVPLVPRRTTEMEARFVVFMPWFCHFGTVAS